MNIFDNVNLLNEGEQAEAYKAKKAAEEEARKKEVQDKLSGRYRNETDGEDHHHGVGSGYAGDKNPNRKRFSDMDMDSDEEKEFMRRMGRDSRSYAGAHKMATDMEPYGKKYQFERTPEENLDHYRTLDAIRKDQRKHPEKYDRLSGLPQSYYKNNKYDTFKPGSRHESTIFESVYFLND